MNKKKLFVFTTVPMLGYMFLPVLFQNILLPGVWFGSLLLYICGLLIVKPKIFLAKEFFVIYFLSLIYYLLVPYTVNQEEQEWLLRRIVPLFVGVSLYTYYFRYTYDPKGLRILFWLVFAFTIITSITTLYGLFIFPEASRELASNARGDTELAINYQRLGVAGYGFISALAYLIPLVVLLFKKDIHRFRKIVWFGIVVLLTITVIRAQYTTQLALFIFALCLALIGLKQYAKYKILIVFIIVIFMSIPSTEYANITKYFASILDSEILSSRLNDLAETISGDSYLDEDTHTSQRVQRIPFLFSEFIKSPLIGGGKSTGHVFWLDHLSLYGIVGVIPWLYLLISIYKRVKLFVVSDFYYFQIAFLAFVLLGMFKNSGNREQYTLLFFILPAGLYLLNKDIFGDHRRRINYATKYELKPI